MSKGMRGRYAAMSFAGACTMALSVDDAHAICNGNPSSDRFTVFIRGPNANCTGVLVTPRWVLTANHCVNDHDNFPDAASAAGWKKWADVEVVIPAGGESVASGVDLDSIPSTRRFWHTNGKSGNILVRTSKFMNMGDADEVSRDFALIKLDKRVDSHIATPIHPPILGETGCPQNVDFQGRIVGFGENAILGSSDPPRRRYQESDGADWYRSTGYTYGGIYNNYWFYVGVYPTNAEYYGSLPGDSGGPLVWTDLFGKQNLCGIGSRYYPGLVAVPYPPFAVPAMFSDYADVRNVLDWIESAIVRRGWFEGECQNAPLDDTDEDNDMVPDACDNCLGVMNTDQANHNDDPYGDACDYCGPDIDDLADPDCDGCDSPGDPCPYEGNMYVPSLSGLPPDTSCGDYDKDGICNSMDECPFVFNPGRENSNLLSEETHDATRLVDACEPVPVARSYAWPPSSVQVMGGETLNASIYIYDKITIEPQPSRAWTMHSGPVAPKTVNNVSTHFRFCQKHPTNPDFCTSFSAVQDFQLRLDVTAAQETPSMPYHRVTMSVAPSGRGATKAYNYDGATVSNSTWNYKADAQYWKTNGQVNVPPPEGQGTPFEAGVASGLDGTFWVHAATPVGSTVGVGAFKHPIESGGDNTQLANSHFKLDPESVLVSTSMVLIPEFFFLPLTLPDPMSWKLGAGPLERFALTKIAANNFGIVEYNGRAIPQNGRISSALNQSLGSTDVAWVAASEPHDSFGGYSDPLAVAIAKDGTGVTDGMVRDTTGDKLVSWFEDGFAAQAQSESGFDNISAFDSSASMVEDELSTGWWVDNPVQTETWKDAETMADTWAAAEVPLLPEDAQPSADDVGASSSSLMASAGPAPLVGFGSAYSRYLRSVFVVGGSDAVTGQQAGDVWRYSLEDNRWMNIAPRIASKVLSAAVSFADRRLYFIDEKLISGTLYRRLVRVDGVGDAQAGTAVAQWRRTGLYERIWLAIDRDGSVLVVGSSTESNNHRIVRFRVDGVAPRSALVYEAPGKLHWAPMVDLAGYTLYKRATAGRLETTRLQSMVPRTDAPGLEALP